MKSNRAQQSNQNMTRITQTGADSRAMERLKHFSQGEALFWLRLTKTHVSKITKHHAVNTITNNKSHRR